MENIQKNILRIRSDIAKVRKKYFDDSKEITLVAISKSQPIEKIKMALETGQKHFGESYLQEALDKIKKLNKNNIIWHYIGKIQSKKTKLIALNFNWVQSVSSYEIALLLNKHRPLKMEPLNVCIQVNISKETTKSGVLTNEIIPLAKKIHEKLPRLKLRGLMTIPAYCENPEEQFAIFNKPALEFKHIRGQTLRNGSDPYGNIDTLSMGMSHDFEAAVASCATMVRIGSAIFGNR